MIDHIQARRNELAAQMAQAQQQYAELEQTLTLLDRQLCAMAGGLQELDDLLEASKEDAQQCGDERQHGERIAGSDNQDEQQTNHGGSIACP